MHCFYCCVSALFLFFLMIPRPPRSTLFPTRRLPISSRDATRRPERLTTSLAFRPSPFPGPFRAVSPERDRKSTRLNSSHRCISYAVFCLKKKKNTHHMRSTLLQKEQNTRMQIPPAHN